MMTQKQQQPILLPSLRMALSCLYALPSYKNNNHGRPTPLSSSSPFISGTNTNTTTREEEANSFLIQFQNRNVRRNIEAMMKSHINQQQHSQMSHEISKVSYNEDLHDDGEEEDEEEFFATTNNDSIPVPSSANGSNTVRTNSFCGSTWLACVVLLCCTPDAHPTERLFAAQTILHRMRRMDLLDAVDMELEFMETISSSSHLPSSSLNNIDLIQKFYHQPYYAPYISLFHWCSSFYPVLGQILFPNGVAQVLPLPKDTQEEPISSPTAQSTKIKTQQEQQQWKAELSLLALSASAAVSSYHSLPAALFPNDTIATNNPHFSYANSISPNGITITTAAFAPQRQQQHSISIAIGGAISLVAIRMKYTTSAVRQDLPPLISIITRALHKASSFTLFQMLPSYMNEEYKETDCYKHNKEHVNRQQLTIVSSVGTSLAELPDVLLGSVGGTRGKLSLHPNCIHAAAAEIRQPSTGIDLVMQLVAEIFLLLQSINSTSTTSNSCIITNSASIPTYFLYSHAILLDLLHKWACFIPLTIPFVETAVLPLVVPYLVYEDYNSCTNTDKSFLELCTKSAYALLIAILEGSYLSEDQVLALSFGLHKTSSSNCIGAIPSATLATESRSKGKAKRRREQKLHALRAIEETATAITNECFQRKEVAFYAIFHTLSSLQKAVSQSLSLAAAVPDALVDGEASIATLCAAAASVLPHLLRNRRHINVLANHDTSNIHLINNSKFTTVLNTISIQSIDEIFHSIFETLKLICRNTNRNVRRMAHESVKEIHRVLVETEFEFHEVDRDPLVSLVVDGIFQCLTALASSCSYPDGYFDDLACNVDEDLENERNDVRDILRSATNLEYDDRYPPFCSIEVLEKLVSACMHAVQMSGDSALPPESAIHCLSALAKPINKLASNLLQRIVVIQTSTPFPETKIIQNALQTLSLTCKKLLSHVMNSSISVLLPVSRLASLTIAALSPTFSAVCSQRITMVKNPQFSSLVEVAVKALNASLHHAVTSLLVIPELAAVSTLSEAQYDIVGAMRAPGGEDHCSCIALTRLLSESECLCHSMWQFYTDPISGTDLHDGSVALLSDLCFLHQKLHQIERSRGIGVVHGIGVLPKTRRILLNTTFQIGLDAMKLNERDHYFVQKSLHELVYVSLNDLSVKKSSSVDVAAHFHLLCEAAYDVGAFPFQIAKEVFNSDVALLALENATFECINGYNYIMNASHYYDLPSVQWGRLRGGLVSLFRAVIPAGSGNLRRVLKFLQDLIIAECKCVMSLNPLSNFDTLLGDNVIPFGAFVNVLGEFLSSSGKEIKLEKRSQSDTVVPYTYVVAVLHGSFPFISQVVSWKQAEERKDPRPFIFEAWCICMRNLSALRTFELSAYSRELTEELFTQSICLGMHLILCSPLSKKKSSFHQRGGMSLDGPHILALLEFMEGTLDSKILANVGMTFAPRIKLSFGLNIGMPTETECVGGALILASIFRMISGALPPYVVENVPGLFSSMFVACQSNTAAFCRVFQLALEATVVGGEYSGISSNERIGGPFMENLTESSKSQLISQANAAASRNDVEGWRRMKVLVKQVCGGKKKATGFNLKPSFSTWDCDRL